MNPYFLTDQQCALIETIFSEDRNRKGRSPLISDRHRPPNSARGMPMAALPDFFGNWMTIFMCYKHWIKREVLW